MTSHATSYRALIASLRDRVRSYIAKSLLLPRQEIREIVAANLRAAAWIGAGLAFVLLFLIAFVVFIIALLALGLAALTGTAAALLPLWLSALVVLVVFGAIAGVVIYVGVKRIEIRGPERTIKSFKETVAWVKATLLGRSAS